jgi:hypothetical protein
MTVFRQPEAKVETSIPSIRIVPVKMFSDYVLDDGMAIRKEE